MFADLSQWLLSDAGLKALAIGAVFLVFFIGERLAAAAPAPKSKDRLIRNAGLWVIVLAASPLIVAPLTVFGANHLLWARLETLQYGVLILLADIILLDLWTYWMHRAWHEAPVLWRFHQVHHFDEFLDTTSAFRFHLGEVIISAVLRLIPIMLLAIPLAHVLLFETALVCFAIFHHSNLRLPATLEQGLSRIIITPSIHWVHHHAVRADTDSNYGAILSLWDRLFGSKSQTARTREMKIGVESIEDKPLLRLMLAPFLRSGS